MKQQSELGKDLFACLIMVILILVLFIVLESQLPTQSSVVYSAAGYSQQHISSDKLIKE